MRLTRKDFLTWLGAPLLVNNTRQHSPLKRYVGQLKQHAATSSVMLPGSSPTLSSSDNRIQLEAQKKPAQLVIECCPVRARSGSYLQYSEKPHS